MRAGAAELSFSLPFPLLSELNTHTETKHASHSVLGCFCVLLEQASVSLSVHLEGGVPRCPPLCEEPAGRSSRPGQRPRSHGFSSEWRPREPPLGALCDVGGDLYVLFVRGKPGFTLFFRILCGLEFGSFSHKVLSYTFICCLCL